MVAVLASIVDVALVVVFVLLVIGLVVVGVFDWVVQLRAAKRTRIEQELSRTEAVLRTTIVKLASELGADAHEARKALIQASFLASRPESQRPC